jgi:hypothetical protein
VETLINTDFNVNFYGGSDANSLVLLKSFVNSGGGAAAGPGTFVDLSGVPVTVPGATTSGFFRIEAWIGGSVFGGPGNQFVGQTAVFSNPLGNAGLSTDLMGMPAVILTDLVGTSVSELSSFALAGIGAAALLIFRRRKS